MEMEEELYLSTMIVITSFRIENLIENLYVVCCHPVNVSCP